MHIHDTSRASKQAPGQGFAYFDPHHLSEAQVQALWRSYSFIFGEGFETGDTSAWTSHTP